MSTKETWNILEITKESVNLTINVVLCIIYRPPNMELVPFTSDIDLLLCNNYKKVIT